MSTAALRQARQPAQPIIVCHPCGRAAVVFVSCDEARFRAPLCNACAAKTRAAVAPHAVRFEKLADVALPVTIDGIDGSIDLAQLAREILDCVVGDHDVRAVQTMAGAVNAAADVVRGKIRRPFLASEEAALVEAVRAELMKRFAEKRSNLSDIQQRLASPARRMFA